MKESVSKQVIRLLRDMLAAMRARDQSLKDVEVELHATSERLRSVESELDDVKTELARYNGALEQLLENQKLLMGKLLGNGGE